MTSKFSLPDNRILAELLSQAASRFVLPRYRALAVAGEVEEKAFASDLVTIADREAEEWLTSEIEKLWPSALVFGEEAQYSKGNYVERMDDADLCFIIDPVDGTWNFANGVPLFGMMVSILARGETIAGVIYDPLGKDYIHAARGQGAWRGTDVSPCLSRLSVSGTTTAAAAKGFIPDYLFGYKYGADVRRQVLSKFAEFERISSFRCSAYEYRLISQGAFDFNLTSGLAPWDHAAGTLIFTEAGGHVARLDGKPYRVSGHSGTLISASTPELLEQISGMFKFLA